MTILFCLILALLAAFPASANTSELSSGTVGTYALSGVEGTVYYCSANPMEEGSRASLAVIYIHGLNSGTAVSSTHQLLMSGLEGACILAPLFPTYEAIGKKGLEPDGRSLWNKSRLNYSPESIEDDWKGGGDADGVDMSSYDVIDRMLELLSDKTLYPNLKRVVLAGFSAGGQFVDRYIAVGKAEVRSGVELDFVSLSPSSNLYLARKARWHYGLKDRPRYCRDLSLKDIRKNLFSRKALHGCGTLDVSRKGALDGTDCARSQGTDRYERFLNYEKYVSRFPKWKRQCEFYSIEGVAHKAQPAFSDPYILKYIKGEQ